MRHLIPAPKHRVGMTTALWLALLTAFPTISCDTQRLAEFGLPEIVSIGLNPPTLTLRVGESGQLAPAFNPTEAGSGRTVTWRSSNPSVATVSSTGAVSALGAGSTTVSAEVEGHVGSASVTVNPAPPAQVAAVSVSPSTPSIQLPGSVQLAATTLDSVGNVLSGRAITWASASPGTATVSGTGLVTGVAAGQTTILATSEGVTGTATVTVSAAPPPPPPPVPNAPTGLSATVQGQTSIALAWTDNASNETNYHVERQTNGGAFSEIAVLGANVTSWTSTGLTASTSYGYRVRAYNGGGFSTYTNVATATTAAPAPNAPSGLSATVQGETSIALAWTDNASNETNYHVERQTNGGVFSEVAVLGANVTSWTSTGLTAATSYGYRVRAYNGSGFSTYSNVATATTAAPPPPPPPPVPTAPSGLTATAQSSSSIALAWADNAGDETGYRVERQTNGGAFSEIAQLGANVTSYSNTGLTASTTYGYRVRAVNGSGFSSYSNTATATTPAATTPPPGGTVLFQSDWSLGGLGSSLTALRDGTRWTAADNPVSVLSVVAPPSFFPVGMTGALRIGVFGEEYGHVEKTLPVPAAGTYRSYRWVWGTTEGSQSAGGFDHGIELAIGSCAFDFNVRHGPRSAGIQYEIGFAGATPLMRLGLSSWIHLARSTAYQVEVKFYFPTSSSARILDIRIYDVNGTVLYDGDDWAVVDPNTGAWSSVPLSQSNVTRNLGSLACFDNWLMGYNGQAGFGQNGGYRYYGGVRIANLSGATVWQGPWTLTGG